MFHQRTWLACGVLAGIFGFQDLALWAQAPAEAAGDSRSSLSIRPKSRITDSVDDQARITLTGNRHPLARPEFEAGLAPPDRRMERMILALDSDPDQQKALNELLTDQHNPRSPRYHQWLTPESFGRQFGVSVHDLDRVAGWLRSHGLDVDEIPGGRRAILFSGSVAQVESAFHTQMRAYNVNGETHYANATDPEIPRALAGVIHGVAALHDFRSKPAHAALEHVGTPQLSTGGGIHYVAPGDFATIYDLGPLHQNSIDGAGQSIAIVARSNIHLSDVQAFRNFFGLPANNPTVILNGTDPGIVSNDEESEADLDAEWAGAVAKNAKVQLVVSASTSASDGVYLSAVYIVNHNLAPVMSMSFGLCEAALGPAGNALMNSVWQQAAAQGITVVVSSGDNGAAGCDSSSAATAVQGSGVNGLCSTPYSVCVGGTEFNDALNPSLYWSATGDPATRASALGYIPEMAWNDSGYMPGGSGLWATGGGASSIYAKPSWQTGGGVPADGQRDVPDISFNASLHDAYLIAMNAQLYAAGGTSASTPSLAGLMAMVVQKTGARQGNANPTLYVLASNQQSGGAAVFHDVTTGNNTVPGVTGFNAGPGYDLATGLGSVDGALLVNHWSDAALAPTPGLQLGLSTGAVSLAPGNSAGVNVTVGVSGGFSSVVLLSATGLPDGMTVTFSTASIAEPGSGVSTLTLTASPQVTAGTYNGQITASGGGITQTVTLGVTVAPPAGLALTLWPATISIKQGALATIGVSVNLTGGLQGPVTLSVPNLPAGLAAGLSPGSLAASGSSVLMLIAGAQAPLGTYTIQVTATGGGITQIAPLAVTITPQPGFTLSGGPGLVTVTQGATATLNLSVSVFGGFNSTVALSAGALPSGMTARFSPASFAAPGSGISTLTLSASTQLAAGSYTILFTASGGWLTAGGGRLTSIVPLAVVVSPPPGLLLSPSTTSVTVQQGGQAVVNLNVSTVGGFNSQVSLTAGSLPGVTAGFLPNVLPAPGSGTSALRLSVGTGAATGNRTVTITATGGGVTKTLLLRVTVTVPPGFTLTARAASLSVTQGASGSVILTVSENGGFTSPVALSVNGLPNGVAAGFSPASVAGAGAHTSTLKLTALANASVGASPLTITATGGGITNTLYLTLMVRSR